MQMTTAALRAGGIGSCPSDRAAAKVALADLMACQALCGFDQCLRSFGQNK